MRPSDNFMSEYIRALETEFQAATRAAVADLHAKGVPVYAWRAGRTVMETGYMLAELARVEEQLPTLLTDEDGWNALDVDYEPPRVERLWHDTASCRVSLHRIHPIPVGGVALFHPHPWPSAMRVVSGTYTMDVGYGVGRGQNGQPPDIAATITLPAGATYEMIIHDSWHSVAPIGGPALSVMITGKPWNRWSPKPSVDLRPLAPETRAELLAAFRAVYGGGQ